MNFGRDPADAFRAGAAKGHVHAPREGRDALQLREIAARQLDLAGMCPRRRGIKTEAFVEDGGSSGALDERGPGRAGELAQTEGRGVVREALCETPVLREGVGGSDLVGEEAPH